MFPESLNTDAMPVDVKLALVEQLWDELGSETNLPFEKRIDELANQRKKDLLSSSDTGLTHDEVWQRVDSSRGERCE